jgi:hypothetical protein
MVDMEGVAGTFDFRRRGGGGRTHGHALRKAKREHKKLKSALLDIAETKMTAAGRVFVSQPVSTIPMPILPA